MTRAQRNAYNALKRMGVPVIEMDGSFIISAEESNSYHWVSYYEGYRVWGDSVNPELTAVLARYGLFCEWKDPGSLGIYE